MKTTTYIFHVIGTLSYKHVRAAAESAAVQNFHWDRFVLFNHSPLDTDMILGICSDEGLLDHFDRIQVYDVPEMFPGCTADWLEQMKGIDGADRYFSHKADFYLGRHCLEEFDKLEGDHWFVLLQKIDMKSRAPLATFREFSVGDWDELHTRDDIGTWPDGHIGKIAVASAGFEDGVFGGKVTTEWIDGVMHGYTDSVRPLYRSTDDETYAWWGVAWSIQDLAKHVPFIRDKRFWACHMWHFSPHKHDEFKLIPGEEF